MGHGTHGTAAGGVRYARGMSQAPDDSAEAASPSEAPARERESERDFDRDIPSTWSRLPGGDSEPGPESARGRRYPGGALAAELRRGLQQASHLIATGKEEHDRLIGRADLPDLVGDDPVAALGVRLDREADLWRAMALGEIARATFVGRVVLTTAILAFVGTVGLSIVGWAGAALGLGDAAARALLAGAGVLALAVGAGIVAWIGASIRAAHQRAARDAFARADLAELRLHRVAVVLALRRAEEGSSKDALLRLERDTAAPPR
jgi:hypothetical protein